MNNNCNVKIDVSKIPPYLTEGLAKTMLEYVKNLCSDPEKQADFEAFRALKRIIEEN